MAFASAAHLGFWDGTGTGIGPPNFPHEHPSPLLVLDLNSFLAMADGPKPVGPDVLPRVLHEHLDHDAELQRYHHHRNYEQLG